MRLRTLLTMVILMLTTFKMANAVQEVVLDLEPVGYWPADDGKGMVLRDHSGNGNHGSLHHLGWRDGLLDFTGAYQWAEIPYRPDYQGRRFSMGAWVYTRREVIGGLWPGKAGFVLLGNAHHTSGYKLATLYDDKVLFKESEWGVLGGNEAGAGLYVRKDQIVDVVSGGKPDMIGSQEAGDAIAIGQWQHILYTFDCGKPFDAGKAWVSLQDEKSMRGATGTARLYINGQLVQEKSEAPFQPRNEPYLIGCDAVWWLQAIESGTLSGSIRDLVIFDRVLESDEVATLYEKTKPDSSPAALAKSEEKPMDKREVDALLKAILDEDATQADRAEAALVLADKGKAAAEAAPQLAEALEELLDDSAPRLPRVEEILRNALTRALLETAPVDNADLLARALPAAPEPKTLYFSQGDLLWDQRDWHPNKRAYTAQASHDGATYILGPGESFDALEKADPEIVQTAIDHYAPDFPEARDWHETDAPHLYRLPIIKRTADGEESSVYLEGEHFIIYGRDQKVRGWSVAIDNDGFIHIAGGNHNSPDPMNFIPGSWKKMGASVDFTNDAYPSMLYWISREPGDINSMEFVGQRANPHNIPVPQGLNYINFLKDRNGELFIYGRVHVQGIQSWGLYRYDTALKKWEGLGGFAPDVKKEFPEWADMHIKMCCDWLALPTMRWQHDHPHNRVLAWARQAHFYNFIRGWGFKFDPTNRLHVQVPLFGFDEDLYNENRGLYAWSDDGGNTFHRADGTPVELPLTVNPGPGNADVERHDNGQWRDLWFFLLKKAGYQTRTK